MTPERQDWARVLQAEEATNEGTELGHSCRFNAIKPKLTLGDWWKLPATTTDQTGAPHSHTEGVTCAVLQGHSTSQKPHISLPHTSLLTAHFFLLQYLNVLDFNFGFSLLGFVSVWLITRKYNSHHSHSSQLGTDNSLTHLGREASFY